MNTWIQARVRLAPDLLVQASPWVRSVFDYAWAPMRALMAQVRPLPDGLWGCLLRLDAGFVIIHAGDSRYVPGPAIVRGRPMDNVSFVDVADLAEENERPLHVLGHLVDHQLGCGGEINGPWLSEGGGLSERQRSAAGRLPELFSLGYGFDQVARSNLHDYFAQSLACYCQDRCGLHVADPLVEKWFRTNFWSSAFWSFERV